MTSPILARFSKVFAHFRFRKTFFATINGCQIFFCLTARGEVRHLALRSDIIDKNTHENYGLSSN